MVSTSAASRQTVAKIKNKIQGARTAKCGQNQNNMVQLSAARRRLAKSKIEISSARGAARGGLTTSGSSRIRNLGARLADCTSRSPRRIITHNSSTKFFRGALTFELEFSLINLYAAQQHTG